MTGKCALIDALGLRERHEHGKLEVHGTPWQFSETPVNIGRAPKLGEHNEEVLARLGYSSEDIEALISSNAVAAAD